MKKLTTLLLALVACAGTMFASDTQVDGIWYKFNNGNLTAEVTYQGADYTSYSNRYSGEVVIPSSVTYNAQTYTVTSIGTSAFDACTGLTSVTIPNSVTSIGSWAFYDCSSLTSVIIGNSVTSIGGSAFSGCSGLTSVTIPNSVTSIGEYAFWNCTGLTSVTIGNSVTSIGSSAFNGCTGLTSVTIPNSVTSIGNYAFQNCSSLTSVTIPNSVTSIGSSAFYNVPNIVYSGSATGSPWGAKSVNGYVDGYLVYSDDTKTTLITCSSSGQGEIVIPNSVTSIGSSAFNGCTGLTSVTIPNSVTSIGTSAFERCTGLTSVTIPNSVTSIGGSAFYNCRGLTSVTIPNSVTSIGSEAFSGCNNITSVVWNAKNGSGYNFGSQVESFTFGDEVEVIPASICSGMNNLTSLTIPNSVTSIGDEAFYGCSGLTSVTIPNSVTSIGGSAFYNCRGLTSVTIPNSVTSIGTSAFYNVLNIVYSGSATGSPWGAKSVNGYVDGYLVYSDDTKTTLITCSSSAQGEIVIPNSVTSIGSEAFLGCTGLTSLTIPNSVTSIGSEAFSGCNNITSVVWNAKNGSGYNFGSQVESFTFGDEVEVIPASICSGMNNLTSLTIPNSVTSIESFAFYGCSSLTSLTMGNSVASIGDYAFRYCSALSSVEAPAVFFDIQESQWSYYTKILSQVTVNGGELTENALQFIKRSYKTLRVMDVSEATNTEFADETFSGYYNLTNLKLPESLTSISYMMAAGCKNLESITIPESVEEIGQSAFEDCRSITSVDFGENPALTMIGSWAFYNCHELANIDIPEGVTEIGKAAFYGCAYAQAAHLPASLQYIGDNGFALCSKLTEMTVDAVTPPEVENKTFYEVSTEAPIYVPDQSVSAYKSHPVWSRLNIVGRNDIPTAIGDVQSNSQLPTANSQKILSNGQILILRNGNTYTIDGKKVEN